MVIDIKKGIIWTQSTLEVAPDGYAKMTIREHQSMQVLQVALDGYTEAEQNERYSMQGYR